LAGRVVALLCHVVQPSDSSMAFRKQAKIVVTNFHAFQLREKVKAGELTMELLAQGEASPFAETAGQMVRRVCRECGQEIHLWRARLSKT
jgi:hypothetical protein